MSVSYEYAGSVLKDWGYNLWNLLQEGKENPEEYPNNRIHPDLTKMPEGKEASRLGLAFFVLSKIGYGSIGSIARGEVADETPLTLRQRFEKKVIFNPLLERTLRLQGRIQQPRYDFLQECIHDALQIHGLDRVVEACPKWHLRGEVADMIEQMGLKASVLPAAFIPDMLRAMPPVPPPEFPRGIRIVQGHGPV